MNALQQATAIVSKLTRAGYIAYFAGGWVRDFILGHPSEDIDIATNATPAQIMDVFPHLDTVLVGLAFGVVIIAVEGHQFEVATFRKDIHYSDGRRPEKIELSLSPREDALRRDFTINGMFYDPLNEVIHDYVEGTEDLKKGLLRTIGNPHERFLEDRLRMVRAFRFATRFDFNIDPETQQAILENAESLFPAVAMERIWQEFNKMVAYPHFDHAVVEMHRLTLLDQIFPELKTMHINDLRHLVAAYAHFPSACPTILYLMELFPKLPLEQKIDIAKRLTATNKDIQLLEFFEKVQKAVLDEERLGKAGERHLWAHLFSNPSCWLVLEVIAARYPNEQRRVFLDAFRERANVLNKHVDRLRAGKPLVTATMLKERGIVPGKNMGLLLKEAEKMAINEDIHDDTVIMQRLTQHPLWKMG